MNPPKNGNSFENDTFDLLPFDNILYKPKLMTDQQIMKRDGFIQKRGLHVANVVCIGVKKCGTGALRQWLSAHSRIVVSNKEELNFFSTRPRGPILE